MRMLVLVLPALVMALPAGAQETTTRMDLVCVGAGSANKATSAYAFGMNNTGQSGWANVVGNQAVPFEDQVNLWVEGGKGQIRMPRSMLPPIRGGKEGWFEIKNVKVTDDAITGTVGVSFVNHPKLFIDRRTGRISMAGKAGDYSGKCVKFDPASSERAF